MLRFFKRRKPEESAQASTQRLFVTLRALGMRPKHIVDIGANHGNWTRAAMASFPDAKFSVFEPQKRLAEKHEDLARDKRVALYYMGIGDFDGTAPFTFLDRDDSCSFVYSASEAQEQGYAQNNIEIRRLDTMMPQSEFGLPDIVKIDAEGLDLKVLEGGTETLVNSDIVLVEATVACTEYPNTASIILAKMDSLGFRIFDITDLNRTPELGVLWLIEMVFVRKGSSLDTASAVYR